MTIPKHLMEAKICNKNTCEEIRTLKEDIKVLLKENEAKEKVIIKYDNVLNELENKLLQLRLTDVDGKTIVYRMLNYLKELKESDE